MGASGAVDDARTVSRSVRVEASPAVVFDLLTDPARHSEFDGSGTLRGSLSAPERLRLGSRFGMRMRIGLPYTIRNTVVEFEQDRLIAWRHFNGHRWRYELEPSEAGTTVTETFDWSTARTARLLEMAKVPPRNARAVERTLERLRQVVDGECEPHT